MERNRRSLKNKNQGRILLNTVLTILVASILIIIITYSSNYNKQLDSLYDAKRLMDLSTIANEIYEYMIVNNHKIPEDINHQLKMIGSSQEDCSISCQGLATDSQCVNLEKKLSNHRYQVNLPHDPFRGSKEKTFYAIQKNDNERLLIYSCKSNEIYQVKIKK